MHLYEIAKNKVLIHDVTATSEQLTSFRKQEMEKISEQDRVFYEKSHIPYYSSPIFGRRTDIVWSQEGAIIKEKRNSIFCRKDILDSSLYPRKLFPSINYDYDRNIVNSYIEGKFPKSSVAAIQDDSISYYLLTRPYTTNERVYLYSDQDYYMSNIIHIPETLVVLQLLEQNSITLIPKEISQQSISLVLESYSDEIIDELDLSIIQKMDHYGITDETHEKVLKRAKNDKRILNILKH